MHETTNINVHLQQQLYLVELQSLVDIQRITTDNLTTRLRNYDAYFDHCFSSPHPDDPDPHDDTPEGHDDAPEGCDSTLEDSAIYEEYEQD